MKLPDDMFKQELLPYLTVDDIVKLDNACMNHQYRPQLLEKIRGVISTGDKDKTMKASLFKWLGIRRIYLIKIVISASNFYLRQFGIYPSPSSIENDYVDQFRYTKHVVMRGSIRDDMAIFIISHCPFLLSIVIGDYELPDPQATDHTLQSIAEHCTGLQSLSLSYCEEITDAGLIAISEHRPNLRSLKICYCDQITDASIISISTHFAGLQSLNLEDCKQITDASIISISTHCNGLQSLHLGGCDQITDDSIISISTHCTGLHLFNLAVCHRITDDSIISISTHCTELQSLNLEYCQLITDASIILISTHCKGLQSLHLGRCDQITDDSIISISENCTGLKKLNISYTEITEASLIAIAKNCTGLQFLRTIGCDVVSSKKLRRYFTSYELSFCPSIPPFRSD